MERVSTCSVTIQIELQRGAIIIVILKIEAAFALRADGNLLVGAMDGNSDACPNIPITSGNVLTQQDYIDNVANNDNCGLSTNYSLGAILHFSGEINDTSLTMGTKGEFKDGFLDGAYYDFSVVRLAVTNQPTHWLTQ